ncbi:MAG: DNA gyrase subunit A [Candidatus Woesearchaeota archaeon]|nr:DNA gyrase subunit A [Candidatus Woesearchaeota archaeon]
MAEDLPQKDTSKIVVQLLEEEMKSSYLAYSMSVIIGRALPAVADGLKPVHRRVLFGMHELGVGHTKSFKKSARVVGEVMGKFHPHGDAPIYESLVRMAQDWSLRYPLVKGQGNFGSIDGDSAAAMRYTECKLTPLADELLEDLDKKTVEFVPNFDNSLQEPTILPSKAPILLLNGSTGIAVGMATNIPPHNMTETCNAIIYTIDHPEATPADVSTIILGPDFPTGGIICGTQGIHDAYTTGRGKLVVRGKTSIEDHKGKQWIIIDEVPYMVNKAQLVEQIADLVRDKRIQGITDIRDESDREGMRVVIELKQGANTELILNQLYAHSRLQEAFGIILLSIVENRPKICTITELMHNFVKHRQIIVRKRTEYDLTAAQDRDHIVQGLLIALANIDMVIVTIKASTGAEEARQSLVTNHGLTKTQAQSVLDMKLQRLTSLEHTKLKQEHDELIKLILELQKILESQERINSIIKQELAHLASTYGDARRTQIISGNSVVEDESLIKKEDVIVTVTNAGYVKRIPLDTYKAQKRGGKGIIGTETREEDVVEQLFFANTHNYLLCFTSLGKVHWLKVHQVPESGRYAKGTPATNLIELSQNEQVTTFIPVHEFSKNTYLFMTTAKGIVKKTSLEEFSNPRKGGIIALSLEEDDKLISVLHTNGNSNIILATEQGMAVKFEENDVRNMGRTAYGVYGISLHENDKVVGAAIANETESLLTITKNGYGKRSPISEYRLISRGGVGVINIKITEKNGVVVAVRPVKETDEIMLISQQGIIIRTPASQINVIGRNTQGVRVMRLDDTDSVVSATMIPEENGA